MIGLQTKLKAKDIPTLIEIDAGENPFFHVVGFKSPTEGNGGTYTREYWQSVIDILKNGKTIAGGKTNGDGHGALENDFFVTGARHDDDMVYFKIAIPEEGFSSSNAGLIRSLKNGVGNFSIVAHVEERVENGRVFFDEEKAMPRLDFVDVGAMEQVNFNSEKIFEAIKRGRVDAKNKSTVPLKNGIAYKRWAIENQSTEHKRLAGQMLNAMAKEKVMGKDEILQALRNLISTGEISADEVLGLVNKKARNEADEKNEQIVEELKEVLGVAEGELKKEVSEVFAEVEATKEVLGLPEDAPVAEIKATVEEVLEGVLDKEISDTAGTDNKKNSARMYVEKEFKRVGFKNLKNAKKALETDAVYLELKNKSEPVQSSAINWR